MYYSVGVTSMIDCRTCSTVNTWRSSLQLLLQLLPWLQLRFDYDPTMTYRARLLPVRRIVVVSQSNRTQIVISMTFVVVECVVVSSYCSRIVIESQLWYRLKSNDHLLKMFLQCLNMYCLNYFFVPIILDPSIISVALDNSYLYFATEAAL